MEKEKVGKESTVPDEVIFGERLSSTEVFQFLLPRQLNALSEASSTFSCKAGDTIYHKGMEITHFYTVLKGEVTLLLPQRNGDGIVIDTLSPGAMFGSCLSYNQEKYFLTARCTKDALVQKINTRALKSIMDGDLGVGYAIQSRVSEIYFRRYIETANKLQHVLKNITIQKQARDSAMQAMEYLHLNGPVYSRFAKTQPIINSQLSHRYGIEVLTSTKSQYGPIFETGKQLKLRMVLDNRKTRLTCHGTIDEVKVIQATGEYKLGISHLSLTDEEFEVLLKNRDDGPLRSLLFVSSVRREMEDATEDSTPPVESTKDKREIERIKAVTLPLSLIELIDENRGDTPFSQFIVDALKQRILA